MATRASKKDQPFDGSVVDLSKKLGVTLYQDTAFSNITDRLPTGIPQLDYILVGGLPFGRLHEIYGINASGKCLSKDTVILTPSGYKPLGTIFEEAGYPLVNTTKVIEAQVPLINRYGKVEHTSKLTFNGVRALKQVTTRTGLSQKITLNHPLLVMEDGVHVWRKAQDLKVGDFLVTRRGDRIEGHTNFSSTDAFALGCLVADGSFGKTKLTFTNNNKYLLGKVATFLMEYGFTVKEYTKDSSPGSVSLHVNDKERLERFYTRYGLNVGVAKDKVVPNCIQLGDTEAQIGFLQGYFECESSIDKGTIEVTSASRDLLHSVQLMLKNLGVISFFSEKVVKAYQDNKYYRLSITGFDILKFLDVVPYVSEDRLAVLETREYASVNSTNHDTVPLGSLGVALIKGTSPKSRTAKSVNLDQVTKHNLSRNKAKELVAEYTEFTGSTALASHIDAMLDECYYYDKITDIVDADPEPTYDVEMPETHSFIAESIVNHNSTFALQLIRMMQYLNGITVLIDVEGTADPIRASELGVSIGNDVESDRVFLIEPERDANGQPKEPLTVEFIGRRLKEILPAFAETKIPILLIWDSVAQTPSENTLEKGLGNKQPGIQAKALTEFVTHIAPLINGTNVCMIAINQARDEFGSMFGGIDSPGGQAFKHVASVRLEVKRASKIEEEAEDAFGGLSKTYVGHIVRFITQKSKVSTPKQKAEAYLLAETGFDFFENIYRSANNNAQYGLIKSSGAWKVYANEDGEEVFKLYGKDVVPYLREHPEVAVEIFQRELMISFPNWYSPLDNENLKIDEIPWFTGLRERYAERKAMKPKEETTQE